MKTPKSPLLARIRDHHLLQSAGQVLQTPGPRRMALVASVATFLLSMGVIVGTLGFQLLADPNRPLPEPVIHQDLAPAAATTFSDTLKISLPGDSSKYPISNCPPLSKSWVKDENLKPGISSTTANWSKMDFANPSGSTLWLDKTSVSCGETFGVHASIYNSRDTSFVAGARTIQVLRVGWYGGSGARLIWSSSPIELKREPIPRAKGSERLVETHWPLTLSLTVNKDWTPGFYLVNTLSPSGVIEGSYPLVVRSPLGSSGLALMHSSMTWNAYNTFGGYSLYLGPGGTIQERRSERSRIASFDRPIVGSGGNHIHRDAIPLVQFMEKSGINVDQFMDTDIDQWPSLTSSYHGIVLSGHPEYVTRRIQNTLFAARNAGINLAFLGGNSIYWQARLASSPHGPMRRIVEYRFATEDPVTANNLVTIQFDDRRLNIPSTLLTGELTDGVHVYGSMSAVKLPTWLGLPAGSHIDGIDPTSEVERTIPGVQSPPNIAVIFRGDFRLTQPLSRNSANRPAHPIGETSWYTAPSGAAIFDAGITTWSCNLMDSCLLNRVDEKTRGVIESMAYRVLTLWQTKAVGRTLK